MKIEVRHLTKFFGPLRAVDDLSFSFGSGDVVGFVGPNGSGKTTTMSIMATLDVPTAGDVLLDGRSVLDYPEESRRRIGFMPDDLPSLSDITVHEYVDFYGRAFGLRGAALDRATAEVEDFTGVADLRDRTLSALSKGMKQRVSLARALVHDPELLIMDEPANGLDPRARVELRELVKILAENGKAILISSHILTELSEMCTGVVIIERGRLVSGGAISDVAAAAAPTQTPRILIRAIGITPDTLLRTLLETPGVADAELRGPACLAVLTPPVPAEDAPPPLPDEATAAFLAALLARGVRVVDFHPETANLETIFMNVTTGNVQ